MGSKAGAVADYAARYTDGIAFNAGNHWPISVGGQGTAMK
jgi:hypothetical protein